MGWVGFPLMGIGGLMIYSGFTGQPLLAAVKSVLSGKNPNGTDSGRRGGGGSFDAPEAKPEADTDRRGGGGEF